MDCLPVRLFQFFTLAFILNLNGLIVRVSNFGLNDDFAIALFVLLILSAGCFVGSLMACFNSSANLLEASPQEDKKEEKENEDKSSDPVPFAILAEDEAPDNIFLNESCKKRIIDLKKKIFAFSAEELVQGALQVLDDLAEQVKAGNRIIVVSEILELDNEENLSDVDRYLVKEITLGKLQRFKDDDDEITGGLCVRIVPEVKSKII